MGGLSLVHWLIVLVIILILFGRGRISDIMGDFGKGIKSFKEGINEESAERHAPPPQIAAHTPEPTIIPAPTVTPAPPATPTPAETKINS